MCKVLATSLSGQNLQIEDVYKHYENLSASLRLYFSASNPDYTIRFAGEPEAVVEGTFRDYCPSVIDA